MKIRHHSKLLFIGDSITDCGRIYAAGSEKSLGNGYVRLIRDALKVTYPKMGIRIMNKGISGNTVYDLKRRWQRDVLNLNPEWLSVMIGINDVWQQFDNWMPREKWISIAEYEHTLDQLMTATASSLDGLVLMTPYFLQRDRSDLIRTKMDSYGNIVRKIAKKYNAIFVDTQAVFDKVLETTDATELSGDRVHLNRAGHTILAYAFLNAIE